MASPSGKRHLHQCNRVAFLGGFWCEKVALKNNSMLQEVMGAKCPEQRKARGWLVHLSDGLTAIESGPTSSPGRWTGSPKPLIFLPLCFFAFSYPNQNQFCREAGAKPLKLIVLAFPLSNT